MLDNEFDELQTYFDKLGLRNPQVSKAGIDWHCDHILRVTLGVCMACIRSEEADYKPQFTISKFIVLAFNYFPRGRAKAPKSSQSEEEITKDTLEKLLAKCKEKLALFKELPTNANFKHPLFGFMNKKES